MRIDDRQFIAQQKAADTKRADEKQAARKSEERADSAASSKKTDSVALSPRARDIADIAMQLKESSEVREELVNELREKIRNGTYTVSGSDIAAKIVDKAQNDDIF